MRKEDKLLGLREEILTEKSEQTPIEQFQNTTKNASKIAS